MFVFRFLFKAPHHLLWTEFPLKIPFNCNFSTPFNHFPWKNVRVFVQTLAENQWKATHPINTLQNFWSPQMLNGWAMYGPNVFNADRQWMSSFMSAILVGFYFPHAFSTRFIPLPQNCHRDSTIADAPNEKPSLSSWPLEDALLRPWSDRKLLNMEQTYCEHQQKLE